MRSIKELLGDNLQGSDVKDKLESFNIMKEVTEYKEFLTNSLSEIDDMLSDETLGDDLKDVLLNTKNRYLDYLSDEINIELVEAVKVFFKSKQGVLKPSDDFFVKCRKDVSAKSDRMLQTTLTKFSMVKALENMFGAFAVELAGRTTTEPMDRRKLSLEYQKEIVDYFCWFLKSNYLKFQTKEEMSIPRLNSMLTKLLSRGFLISRSLFYNFFTVSPADYTLTYNRHMFESEKQMNGKPTHLDEVLTENIEGTEEMIEEEGKQITKMDNKSIATNTIASYAQYCTEKSLRYFITYPKGMIPKGKPVYKLIQS